MPIRYIVLFTTLLFFNSFFVFSSVYGNDQISQYNIEKLTTKEGLPANGILDVYQTSDKYIWFSTYNGLAQFDGRNIRTINQVNTKGLEIHSFKSMLEIGQTRWYATQGGLVRFEQGKWSLFTKNDGLTDNDITCLFSDQNSNLWVGTSKGLCFFNKRKMTFLSDDLPTELKSNTIVDLSKDKEGNLWIGTFKKGIYKIDIESKEIITSYPQFKNITVLLNDHKGNTWVGGNDYLKIITISGKIIPFVGVNKLPSKNVTVLKEDSKGAIWIGTDNGIARFFNSDISIFTQSKDINKHFVCSILEDNEGNYWVGTYRQGVYKLNNGQFISYSTEHGITGQLVYSISKKKNDILLATNNGITVYHNKKFQPYSFNNQLVTKTIKDVFVDSRFNTWIASKKGVTKIDINGRLKHFTQADGLSNNYARFTFEDKVGNIWVGTVDGLNILKENNEFQTFSTKEGLGNNYILSMFQDSNHCIWICTKSGITTYNKGVFKNFTNDYNLKSEIVFKVMEDSKGVIWFGSNNGIFRYHNDKVFSYHRKIEGDITSAFSIIEDKKNKLFWIASNDGVYTLNIDELEDVFNGKLEKANIKLYNTKDGMKSKSVMANGRSLILTDGSIWYQTDNGVSIVNTNQLIKNEVPPSVIINTVNINGNPIQNINEEIVINEGPSRLEINYVAISYLNPEGIQFKYKLDGFDKDWIYTDNDFKAIYTNLPVGKYKFIILASNQDKVWMDKPITLNFKKKAFFYERPIVQLLFFFTLIIILMGIYKWRVRNFRKKEFVLEKKVSERTKEILEKSKVLQKQSEELQQQSEELQQQSEELQQQRDYLSDTNEIISKRNSELNVKNDEISLLVKQVQSINKNIKSKNKHLTDSIRYAKTMQEALLPNDDKINTAFQDHFIIFKPKDIVSGDFYWMFKADNGTTFIASVDCTGHGVPGGFMSMLGISILNKIIREQKEDQTEIILSRLNTSIINYLQQDNSRIDDGMDLSLCKVEPLNNKQFKVTFSGAKSTMYFFKKEVQKLYPLKGDNISIGNKRKKREFTSQSILLKKGDKLYLSTDGYIDQNNKDRKKIGKKLFEEVLLGVAPLEMSNQKRQLEHLLYIHQKNEPQRDDITVIGVHL